MLRVNAKSTTYLCQQGAPWLGHYHSGFQCLLNIGSTFPLIPNDSLQSEDSDGDGVGDNSDAFPNDSSFWEQTHSEEQKEPTESVPGFEAWLFLISLFAATWASRKLM